MWGGGHPVYDLTDVTTFEGGTVIKYAQNAGAKLTVNSVNFEHGAVSSGSVHRFPMITVWAI